MDDRLGNLPRPRRPTKTAAIDRLKELPAWRLSPTRRDYQAALFFSVTIEHLRRVAKGAGFNTPLIRNFNDPPEAIPQAVRWAARLHDRLGFLPWSWQFVFRKPGQPNSQV